MRRYLRIGLIVLIVGLLGGAGFTMRQTLAAKDALATKLQHLPTLSGVQYVRKPTAIMPGRQPTLIILFDPDCEHCQNEATQIRQVQSAFAGAAVYWLTTQPMARARKFAQQYGLDTLAMMHVGTLTRDEANHTFGSTSVPRIFIYGRDGALRKEYKGEVKIASLLQHL